MLDSAQLRKDILAARNKLTQQEIETKSFAIQQRLLELDQLRKHQSIFVYVSFRSEVATLSLIDSLIELGKTVIVPITRIKEKRLDAIHITNRLTDLVPGYCNIPEPKDELCTTALVAPEEIETILLPGSVFDERGGRFGYGGGYYDRFLAKVPTAARIGLAFELQIIEKAPLQDHDELLDLVVTEKRVIRGGR
ncbi:5-formyltetrahydrofolate cyclo-ligase [Desulfopila sp. IMCC35006]|uniref:5-formyltetrahydrofolate cyclo-ligase n=1 Tax=Desulfopila sp. IMCC35006 TaxID=2569542 RepID=UPI0010AB8264|nr:5-formyltetrahydrofolate cyclo-ligase [Desulfopila sp. IMCC35006]TKB25738.1 5-formyltetrahydrofolate cyclo-ligase [Desulfopila sp. IMCC35006]